MINFKSAKTLYCINTNQLNKKHVTLNINTINIKL